MIKLTSCIEMMFNDLPFENRIKAAKDAGFDAVEFWSWAGKDIEAIKKASDEADIPVAVCCIATATESRIEQYSNGALLVKENADLFAQMVQETIEATSSFGIKTFITTVGQELVGVSRDKQEAAIVSCLKAAVPVLEKYDVTLVVEPLNILVNHKGYYLYTSKQAFDILAQVNSPKVKLLYDIYHQQITEGNLIANITAGIDAIGHFHLADVPGRCQPGTGEINYTNVLGAISNTDYDMWVGCEFKPSEGINTLEASQEILAIAKSFN